jgi:hypothetical protein
MQSFHVIDILIDRPHIKRTLYLPVWVRHITGVLFFPVIPPPSDGIPDGEPLGVAGLSLQNEQLNVVTNLKIYKKSPIFYEAPDYKTAGGEIFLDRGYGAYDFFSCNDTVKPNSFAIFKYTNRKMVKSPTDTERFNADFAKLKSLVGKQIHYQGRTFILLVVQTSGDIIIIWTHLIFQRYEIHKNRLSDEIYRFIDPKTDEPFFKSDGSDQDYDEAFVMKLILRHEANSLNSSNSLNSLNSSKP